MGAVGAVVDVAATAFRVNGRKKLEDCRIVAADRVLMFAYRLADDLEASCNPRMAASELEIAAESIAQNSLTLGAIGEIAFADACKAKALLERLSEREKNWTDFAIVRVMARGASL